MFLDNDPETGSVTSGKDSSRAAEAPHPLDVNVASVDKLAGVRYLPSEMLALSDDGSGMPLKRDQFRRLSRNLSTGLSNVMDILDGSIYRRLKVGGVRWDA